MDNEGHNLLECLHAQALATNALLDQLERLQRDHKDEITPQTGRQIALARTNIEQGRLWLTAASVARDLEMDAEMAGT